MHDVNPYSKALFEQLFPGETGLVVDKDKIKILGLLNDIPLVEKGVSGSRSLAYKHLKERGYISDLIDTELTPVQKAFSLLKNISTSKNKWALKNNLDMYSKHARNRNIIKLINDLPSSFDATLQIGSTFSLHQIPALKEVPKFSYHDNNVMIYFNSGFDSTNIRNKTNYDNMFQKAFNFEKEVYDNLSGIFCMTNFLRESFIQDFQQTESKVHTVGLGCNFNIDSIEDYQKDYSRKRILFVAKDSFREKGGYLLLEAFKKVKNRFGDAELIIVGPKINYDSPGVTWKGTIDKRLKGGTQKIKDLYQQASLFVMPSFGEPAGNVYLEAMAYKLPCIGANQGATAEIISDNNCGFVVDKDTDNLAEKIIELFENEEEMKYYGDNGLLAIREKYNWQKVCEKVLDVVAENC